MKTPSSIFDSAINWLNTYLEIIAGGNIKTQRRRLIWLMPVSLLSPLVGILLAWLVKIIGFSPLSPLMVIISFTVAIVPWLFLLWLTVALYVPLIFLTIPTEYAGKLKELNASPENAKKLARFFADIIAWILFAGLYCFFWKVWNNILAVVPLLFVTLFLLFSAIGKWVEPSPKFKRKLWLTAVILIFLPVTLSFLTPRFYYHAFGRSPSELSNKYPESQNSLEKLNKTVWERKDEELADSLVVIRRMVEKGKISPDSGRVLAEKLSKEIRQKSLLNQGQQGVDSLVQKVKRNWPWGKDASAAEAVLTPPPPPRDTLIVGAGWENIPRPLHYKNKIVFLSPVSTVKFKFSWQPQSEARDVPMSQRIDGLWWGYIEISEEPVDPETRLQIKLKNAKGGEVKIKVVYWVS